MEQRFLCFSLFNRRGGLIGRSLDGVDRELLLRAVRVGLQNEDGRARGSLETVYANLTYDEIKPFSTRNSSGDRRTRTKWNYVCKWNSPQRC